jgi:hypothetical protein
VSSSSANTAKKQASAATDAYARFFSQGHCPPLRDRPCPRLAPIPGTPLRGSETRRRATGPPSTAGPHTPGPQASPSAGRPHPAVPRRPCSRSARLPCTPLRGGAACRWAVGPSGAVGRHPGRTAGDLARGLAAVPCTSARRRWAGIPAERRRPSLRLPVVSRTPPGAPERPGAPGSRPAGRRFCGAPHSLYRPPRPARRCGPATRRGATPGRSEARRRP